MNWKHYQRQAETVPILPHNVEILPEPYTDEGKGVIKVFSVYKGLEDSPDPYANYHAYVSVEEMGLPSSFTKHSTMVLGKVGNEIPLFRKVAGLIGPFGIEMALQTPRIQFAAWRASRLVGRRLRAIEQATQEHKNF